MARDYKYLGKSVRDTRKPGLDSIREVRDIARAIIDNYEAGNISYREAMSEMNLLELAVSRDSDFTGKKKKKAREVVDKYREELMREHYGKK